MTWHNDHVETLTRRRMMNKTYPVPPPPPHNEGKTAAAWTLNLGVVLGALIAAVGLVMGELPIMGIGAGVIVLAIIVGVVMSIAGLGQPRRRAGSASS